MRTATSDIRDPYQDLTSVSHAGLCFTDIPVSDSLSCHSSTPPEPVDYFPPQFDIGSLFISPDDYSWQTPQISKNQANSGQYNPPYVCSNGHPALSTPAAACTSLPSSMAQFYFSSASPLVLSPPQVPPTSNFPPYQSEDQDPTRHFLPSDSPADFDSVAGSSTDEPFNALLTEPSSSATTQWLSLPTPTPASTTSYPLSTQHHQHQQQDYISSSPSTTLPFSPPTTSPLPKQLPSPSQSQPQNSDLSNYGIPTPDPGTWRCAYPGCSSSAIFRRGCDLRKHYNRHRKHLFCRYDGCPQSSHGGFSSKKDRARHEAKHNPGILCEWDGCGRIFSRVDNMKDHVRRIHRKGGRK